MVAWPEFEDRMGRLQKLGFFVIERIIAGVAHAIAGAKVAGAT
jgi:hypothetical protein